MPKLVKGKRNSEIANLSIQVFLLILASTLSYVSFMGGYSGLLILNEEKNIDLDLGFTGDLVANPTTFEIQIEFEVNNRGYFDLEDLNIELELIMVYHKLGLDINGDGKADPISQSIFDDDKSFKTIEAGEEKENVISITYLDMLNINWADIQLNADPTGDLYFIAENVEISAKYCLGLLSFKFEIEEIELGTLYI